MAIDVTESYIVDNRGMAIEDEDGNILCYFATASTDPTGSDAPVNTYVFRSDNQLIYKKTGAGVNDWRQLDATDFLFDVSGLPNFEGTESTIDDALNTLGNQTFADAVNFQDFFDSSTDTTTSNGWVNASTFNSEALPPGVYYVGTACQLGQSDKDKQVGFRIDCRTVSQGGRTVIQPLDTLETVGTDNTYKLISGFGFFTHDPASDDVIQVRVRFGQTDDGGTGLIRRKTVILFKVDDL